MRSCCLCGAKVLYQGIFSIECAGFGCANSAKSTLSPSDRLQLLYDKHYGVGSIVKTVHHDALGNFCFEIGGDGSYYNIFTPERKAAFDPEYELLKPELEAEARAWLEANRKSA